MTYTDAIIYIADLPGLTTAFEAIAPDMVQDGTITGFAGTPACRNGASAMIYIRMNAGEVAQWRGTPGVTILAEAPYTGEATPDAVYAALAADPAALATYDAVYQREPVTVEGVTHTPPFRFGAMG